MTVNVQLQSASGRCESVLVRQRSNDARTCDAALREYLQANDPTNTGGWRVLSLGAALWS